METTRVSHKKTVCAVSTAAVPAQVVFYKEANPPIVQ